MAGESFEVRFNVLHGDLTSARVQLSDAGATTIDAAIAGQRGPYDVWSAPIPATASGHPSYYIELHDGPAVAYLSAGGITDGVPADGGFALDFTTLAHAPLGATPVHPRGAVFRVWAPNATSAALRGQFNAWELSNPMTRLGNDYISWNPNATPGQQYKYFFNGSLWQTDARGRALKPDEFNNSLVQDPSAYSWQVQDFKTPAPRDLVIYQLNVDSFAGRNDPFGSAPFPSRFADVAARAAHLKELGVNAVMLNPVIQWCDNIYAGYTPIAVWAVDARYGTPDQLKAMVDAFHQNGIAVLFDLVWNHFACDVLQNYDGTQIYFNTPAIQTPWGPQANFGRPEVRDLFIHSAYMWFDEYHADGFRMDATYVLANYQAQGWPLVQRLNDDVNRRWRDKFILAEADNPGMTSPTGTGGAGFDAEYHFSFGSLMRQALLSPGIPAMLMGSEWLEDAPFGSSDISNRIDWSKQTAYAPFYKYFRDLIALRRTDPMLRADVPHGVFHLDDSRNVIAYERTEGSAEHTVVIANFGAADLHNFRIGLPSGAAWREALNSQAAVYAGSGLENAGAIIPAAIAADGYPQSATIELPARALVVLRPTGALGVPGPRAGDDEALRIGAARPNPSTGTVTLAFGLSRAAPARVTVLDLGGRLLATLLEGPQTAGPHLVTWDGRGRDGAPARAGVYLLRVESGRASACRRVAVLR